MPLTNFPNGIRIPGYVTIDENGIVLNDTVWEDLNFSTESSGGPAATTPNDVVINGVFHKEFDNGNNQNCGDAAEYPHDAKLASTAYPHLHLFLKDGESIGTTGVTFTLNWELREASGTTYGSVELSATSAELNASAAANKLDVFDVTGFAGPLKLNSQIALKIERTAGDAGDVIVTTYGIHYEIDSIGSNEINSK